MPLYVFDTDNGRGCVTDYIGTFLTDKAAANKEAVLYLLEMAKAVSSGFHEVTVLVKNGIGSPFFRATQTLDRTCCTDIAAQAEVTVPDKVRIISCTSATIN